MKKRHVNDNEVEPPITVLTDLDHGNSVEEREQMLEETNVLTETQTQPRYPTGEHKPPMRLALSKQIIYTQI